MRTLMAVYSTIYGIIQTTAPSTAPFPGRRSFQALWVPSASCETTFYRVPRHLVLILIQMGFAGTLPLLHAKSTCWNRHMVPVFSINWFRRYTTTHLVHIWFRTRKVPTGNEISDGGSYYNMADRLKGSFLLYCRQGQKQKDVWARKMLSVRDPDAVYDCNSDWATGWQFGARL